MVAPPCYAGMKDQNPTPRPDDIELQHPDAWDRFVDAIKRVARHLPPRPFLNEKAGERKLLPATDTLDRQSRATQHP
jgi:hypothetical protein